VPGVSGNPEGRTKLTEQGRHAVYLAKHHSPEAIDKLVKLMRHASSESVQYQAAVAILDRAYGRPAQAVLSAHANLDAFKPEQLKGSELERAAATYEAMVRFGWHDTSVIDGHALPAPGDD
jgi:hypothetical protein